MPLLENIRIDQVIFALTSAIDVTDNRLRLHSHRVAYSAVRLGKLLGLDHATMSKLLMAAVLHDVGILRESEKAELSQLEVSYKSSFAHCLSGSRLLQEVSDFSHLAYIILKHHDPYIMPKDMEELEQSLIEQAPALDSPDKETDNLISCIIHLADRVSITVGSGQIKRSQVEQLNDWMARNSGSLFDPKVVEAYHSLAKETAFWLDLFTDYVYERCQEYASVLNSYHISDIMDIGQLFAKIIDMRSPFTVRHSNLVSSTAERLGEKMGFSKEECRMLKLAGLLHDLGKLAIPNRILEKDGALAEEERDIIRSHTYFTYNILNKIQGMETIKIWAAYHHERMDGNGYPFRLKGDDLPLGSKIMAVADVYSALAEKRPYKDPFPPERIMEIMRKSAGEGGLDPQVVDAMFDLMQSGDLLQGVEGEDADTSKTATA